MAINTGYVISSNAAIVGLGLNCIAIYSKLAATKVVKTRITTEILISLPACQSVIMLVNTFWYINGNKNKMDTLVIIKIVNGV